MTVIKTEIVVGDRYRLLHQLPGGIGSTVYQGEDIILNRSVAVKLVLPQHTLAYRASLGASTHIGHPAFVGIFDSLEHDGMLAIVQEYITGQRFDTIATMDLAPLTIAKIARSLALALAHAHRQGVIHGDITPSALFRDAWNPTTVRINNVQLPPNLNYFANASRLLASGTDLWEPEVPTIRDDLRAIGVIIWLLLAQRSDIPLDVTGQADDWRYCTRTVPDAMRSLVERTIDPEHPARIDTAELLVQACQSCIRTLGQPSSPLSLPPWERQSLPITIASPFTPIQYATDEQRNVVPDSQTPFIVGDAFPNSDNDVTWDAPLRPMPKPVKDYHVLATTPEPSPTQTPASSQDIVFWVALSIGLFLFWLVIGYLIPGLFGK